MASSDGKPDVDSNTVKDANQAQAQGNTGNLGKAVVDSNTADESNR